jgi:hypothetical protein
VATAPPNSVRGSGRVVGGRRIRQREKEKEKVDRIERDIF